MHLDPIVKRRFSELQTKGEAVLSAKEVDFVSAEGKSYYKVPSGGFKEWATNVLNLLHRTFGEQSIHYKNFYKHYKDFRAGHQTSTTPSASSKRPEKTLNKGIYSTFAHSRRPKSWQTR